ncbi:hypothetical protein PLESTB_000061100 [Pleodorina starrii]|uniref:Uncharacterized protein n=1 Tax=Pleodorina starrii TaxID=330485 RepID=A0A9W6EX67_9CHLO|nr:hypothetical protein PLESTB_000061100 [Pleodorina starrii]GLC67367.1 hypothetical protein PLESTF_000548400 [Pleodorina starrii]
MPTGVEEATTIWVNVGSAASLVGATLGATYVGALAIMKGLENSDDLVDDDAKAQQTGQELQAGAQRTRLRAEDVLAAQEQVQAPQEPPVQPPK